MTSRQRSALTAAAATVLLLVIYVASMAPTVTLWDAGEFIAATRTLGVPHPPGTPLFILIGRSWTLALGFLSTAVALNLFSGACTAAAGGLTAMLVFRSTRSAATAIASALIAGTMSTVWLNATETEVYAASLLLSVAMILAGDQAGRTGEAKWSVLTAYLIALSVPLHLSALVAAPAAIVLACDRGSWEGEDVAQDRRASWTALLDANHSLAFGLSAVVVFCVAASKASVLLTVIGVVLLVVSAIASHTGPRWRSAMLACVAALAFSALAFMLVRASHAPGINQGDPSTFARWIAVITREQYDVAPLWPRQAPLWIQLGNVLQYFDWQFALGVAPDPMLSAGRGVATIVGIILGAWGCEEHKRIDPRRWRGVMTLFLAGSFGVLVYLNLKAGPSIGWDILPDSAPHEPRERDYFFVLAFWAWGIWAALGAGAAIRYLLRPASYVLRQRSAAAMRQPRVIGSLTLVLALAPALLNWRAVERRSEPGASIARLSGLALLSSAPPRAVMFVAGDNDSYPLWYLQQVERFRTDVSVVTIPILGADWYRAELLRRHGLHTPDDWRGLSVEMSTLAADARKQGRPVVAAVSVDPSERAALGQFGRLRGWVWETDSTRTGNDSPSITPLDSVLANVPGLSAGDRAKLVASIRPVPARDLRFLTPAQRYMLRLLGCPRLALESAHHKSAADSLDSTCNFR
jgi:hypothetical protein